LGRRLLALIRHGEYAQPAEVPSAHLPYGLTARGAVQARAAAATVLEFARQSELTLDPIIDCSRLRRAWETANLMAEELTETDGRSFACREFDALAERSVGAVANLSVDAIEAILRDDPRCSLPPPGWKRSAEYRLPFLGCESLAQAGGRVAEHLRRCAAGLLPGGSTGLLKLVVGHGGAFRHAAHELGVLSSDQVASLSMAYGVPVYLEVQRAEGEQDRFVHVAGHWTQRPSSAAID
jgi:2,3-bisphosphoglycerate-dependent phosphoglycerate mutase